ncbi:MmcQ/YjbR family DNA-binding protein [Microbacterium sp.]|uniref:MmcQ/YjbR family DNA-binding protein n=1 Tax=Microbacterium sp. TaxID=51671 RepID=UPI0028111690|nr:MmcQ/YjbR family DNA-binding protein [Microbacterium sp.]
MADVDDVREIAFALPGTVETVSGHTGEAAWRVKSGQFAWLRRASATDERQLAELGRSWPAGAVLGVRVQSLEEKEALLATDPGVVFTIPHFDGYPAVLVELDVIDGERLTEIVTDAWLTRAPARVAKTWLAEHGLS